MADPHFLKVDGGNWFLQQRRMQHEPTLSMRKGIEEQVSSRTDENGNSHHPDRTVRLLAQPSEGFSKLQRRELD
jgi:hypothetical protein